MKIQGPCRSHPSTAPWQFLPPCLWVPAPRCLMARHSDSPHWPPNPLPPTSFPDIVHFSTPPHMPETLKPADLGNGQGFEEALIPGLALPHRSFWNPLLGRSWWGSGGRPARGPRPCSFSLKAPRRGRQGAVSRVLRRPGELDQ